MCREQIGGGLGPASDDQRVILRFDSGKQSGQWAGGLEPPVGRSALGLPQLEELTTPPAVGPERQPLHDEPVDRLQHQHLGQQELSLGRALQLRGGLVAEAQQLVASDGILEAFDALEDVLLIVLLVGIGRPPTLHDAAKLRGAQHDASAEAECRGGVSWWRLRGDGSGIIPKFVFAAVCVNAKKRR